MRKRLSVFIVALTMVAGSLVGCGSAQEAAETASQTEEVVAEAVAETSKAEEEALQIANPWVEITEEEAVNSCTRLFKAPEGATDVVWRKCESLGNPDEFLGPLVQLDFKLDGREFTARAQQGAAEDADITGLYVDWTVGPEDCTLANWGEGHMAGQSYRAITDTAYIDLITWYDVEIGIAYALTVSDADLDGFDIQAIAEQMYTADNEPYVG